MSMAATSTPDTPAFALLAPLTDGAIHAVVITDQERRIVGLVTQTDLLIAISRVPEGVVPAA
jgi:CBS domain-containing membrane protein